VLSVSRTGSFWRLTDVLPLTARWCRNRSPWRNVDANPAKTSGTANVMVPGVQSPFSYHSAALYVGGQRSLRVQGVRCPKPGADMGAGGRSLAPVVGTDARDVAGSGRAERSL
jgi:hypothetical protein